MFVWIRVDMPEHKRLISVPITEVLKAHECVFTICCRPVTHGVDGKLRFRRSHVYIVHCSVSAR